MVRQGCRVWGLPPRLDTALHAQDPAMGSQGPTESQGPALHVAALSSHGREKGCGGASFLFWTPSCEGEGAEPARALCAPHTDAPGQALRGVRGPGGVCPEDG